LEYSSDRRNIRLFQQNYDFTRERSNVKIFLKYAGMLHTDFRAFVSNRKTLQVASFRE